MDLHAFNWLLIAVGGVLVLVFLLRTKRRLRELTEAEATAAAIPREPRAAPQAQAPEASVIRAIELHRELEARLQNRAALLERLIGDADARIAALRRERDRGAGA